MKGIEQKLMCKIAFFGAKSLALGMYKAVHYLYPETVCMGFIVSSLKGNPHILAGKRVWELRTLRECLSSKEKENLQVLIAVPEDLHTEIMKCLRENGFGNYICMDSHKEARLMEKYFTKKKIFQSLHLQERARANLCVYQAKFCGDRQLEHEYKLPEWVIPLQVGAAMAVERVCEQQDNQGDNISKKNANYCELTALYWLWKNKLSLSEKTIDRIFCEKTDYYGLFHYRRILDITEDDLYLMKACDVDVVLPFPTLHEPNIDEHHARYMDKGDWRAMRQALLEINPEYSAAFDEILMQPYFYNYNLIVAREQVLADYCAWLFPILERTEELSIPKGSERADRYIGYMGENLATLYFMYHKDDLKIVHTGRIMLI